MAHARTRTTTSTSHRWLTLVWCLALFAFAMWQFLPAINDRDFHRDEARWIHRSEYLRELLHPFSPYWTDATWADGASMDEVYRLRAQPPVGSYLIGLGFLLQGQPLPDIGYWNMDHDDDWNAAQGNMPTNEMLRTARRTTSTIAALTVVTTFLIGRQLTSTLGGAIAAVYLALHPLTRYLATFAGSDAALALFIALSALFAARLVRRPSWPNALLLGLALGLGTGTKLSPFGIALAHAAYGAVLAALARRRKHAATRRLPIALILQPVIAAAVFVLTYPWLWRNPIRHSLDLLDYRRSGMEVQGQIWEQVAVDTHREALQRIWIRFTGTEWSVIGRFTDRATPIEGALALVGLIALAVLVARRGLWSPTALIAVALGSAVAITILGLRVDWARYHLPILLGLGTCLGGAAGCLEIVVRQALARQEPIPPANRRGHDARLE